MKYVAAFRTHRRRVRNTSEDNQTAAGALKRLRQILCSMESVLQKLPAFFCDCENEDVASKATIAGETNDIFVLQQNKEE